MDEIFINGIQELDRAKRKAMYAEWVQIAYASSRSISWPSRRVDAIRRRFGNVFPSPGPLWEFASFHNEEELYLLNPPGSTSAANMSERPGRLPVTRAEGRASRLGSGENCGSLDSKRTRHGLESPCHG